jgi:hypothetical protein
MKTEPTSNTTTPLPPVVDEATWQRALDELRVREKRRDARTRRDRRATTSLGRDVGAPPGGGFAVNVFLRGDDDTV